MRSTLKIAHIITRFIRGGADENTLLSCNGQASLGHDVHLICGQETSHEMLRQLDQRVTVHRVCSLVRSINPFKDAKALLKLIIILRSINPDIVHTHTSKAGILGRCAARLCDRPAVIHGVHILPFLNVSATQRIFYLLAERLVARFTDAFVSVSQGMRDACLESDIGTIDSHFVVPSGMDIHSFALAQALDDDEVRRSIPDFNPDLPIILMVAALEKRKRIVEFLDVYVQVLQCGARAQLIILGEGVDRQRIEAAIAEKNLRGLVHLPGFQDQIQRWIQRSDICVLASEREGLPRAIIQYIAAGKPCVVTHLPGVGEVVKDGFNGFLIPVEDLDKMVDPIVRLLSDISLLRNMSCNARNVNLEAWSTESMIRQLEQIYSDILKAGVSRRHSGHAL
jgi:glycosyltransferase involved in cell wall biosynthesis